MNRPTLILLVGIPGSGKTTCAEKYIEEHPGTVHLSSDKIRAELWGSEATQGDNNEVFSLMQSRVIEALNNGLSVLYDATNVTRKDRAYIISLCPKFVKIECHIVWAPIETCIERDAARERTVGKEVIDKMLKRFQSPWYDEGIDDIKVIWNTPDDFNQETYVNNLVNASDIPHDNPHHTLNIKEHCDEAYHYAIDHHFPSYLLMAAKYHDVGKPYVKAFIDSKGNPSEHAHYYQHQCISAYMYYGVDKHNFFIAWLISVHMDPFLNTKYYNKLPPYLKKQVDLLHEADLAAH
jgi:predicted kinase